MSLQKLPMRLKACEYNMEEVIIIRFGEIFLKGKNKKAFEKLLLKNIKNALSKENITYEIISLQNRYYIKNFRSENKSKILDIISSTFGIYSYSVGYVTKYRDTLFEEVGAILATYAKELNSFGEDKNKTFRITTNRANKAIAKSSSEISAYLASFILDNCNLKVDLKNFDYEYTIDIRENGDIFIFNNINYGQGGLPVGCSSHGLLLLSGGIDSPVAGYMMAKRGMKLSAIHFASPPYTSEGAKNKVIQLRNIISKYCTDITLYIVPFTEIQMSIHKNCLPDYMITIMRRFMMKIANKIAVENNISAIVTGESLGQVASQTVESMVSTESVSDLPIFRPIIGMDKEEIINIAKKIKSFETSILPFEDCCTVFLPKNPIIHPKLETVEKIENQIKNIDDLIETAIKNMEIV